MGIWRQRIEGSWVKCTGAVKFRIMNLKGSGTPDDVATVVSLKHKEIDFSKRAAFAGDGRSTEDYSPTGPFGSGDTISGLIYDGIGSISATQSSYIIDYYFGPSITSTKKFLATKNYQFKTHTINFANVGNVSSLSTAPNFGNSLNKSTFAQANGKLYNSELNCFKGSLGINPSWEDTHFFSPPYYSNYIRSAQTPTTMILYYYSSPKEDTDSGFFSYTNKLSRSIQEQEVGGVTSSYKIGTQSVYQASYGISGVEINETSWKIQGYSYVSYDNNPTIGEFTIGLTNSYSGPIVGDSIPNRKALKQCVFGKGWYYDDWKNEYTWYHRIFPDQSLNENNNPVGGEAGFQDSHEGYIENNYIAKYIPFQKFNLSFLYENIRTDAGIKIYLSPTLPSSKPLESSKYTGRLLFPPFYLIPGTSEYNTFVNSSTNIITWPSGEVRRGSVSLVSSSAQVAGESPSTTGSGLSQSTGNYFPFLDRSTVYAPVSAERKVTLFGNYGFRIGVAYDSIRSTIIRDYPAMAISNNIYVDDPNTNLKEIRINITLRHTYVGDMIINLRAPNGKIINLKAKYSGDSFNDLRNITFTTNESYPKMKGFGWWPGLTNSGFIYDPFGTNGGYPVTAPWLPGVNGGPGVPYNFNWSRLRILRGLTFQMDKINGQGTSLNLYDGSAAAGGSGWSNAIYSSGETIDFRSNVNELKHLVNDDGTFFGTYSLYIKDDWGSDSGMLESWNIEFLYKRIFTPILSLTQSDPSNAVNKGAPKLQYLFGLEGNQYLFIVGDKLKYPVDYNQIPNINDLRASLKNLKIDGGFHPANNKLYAVNDKIYGRYDTTTSGMAQSLIVAGDTQTTISPTFSDNGVGGENTFEPMDPIENVSYSTYVGIGDLNNPTTLSLSGVNAKIGNGKFISGIWENGAWNSGWRSDENMQEFYNIDQFFSYNRDKTWRFSIFGSVDAASKFSLGDKVSIGNIVAIDVNEERKLIKSYFTIVAKTVDSISVEFESDFPIRRIKIDSSIHRIYVTKNVWLSGAFLNGYFKGIWNSGLFRGFPYITEMYNSHWIDGTFNGGHFYSRKKTVDFANVYLATYNTIKVGVYFTSPHRLTQGDEITISSNFGTFGDTKVLLVTDDYRIIVDLEWNSSRDPNTYGSPISGKIYTGISTGLVQNFNFSANNTSSVTSLQSMDSTRVFIYDSWIDVNFDSSSAVNIGKPQSTIDNRISSYSYSENNLYGYPTYDVLSSDVAFRDSFSGTIRKYKLGSKYKIYQDYIGDAGSFDDHFDITGWATKTKPYPTNTFPFIALKTLGSQFPTSQSFANQGWVINKYPESNSAISFERTTEALDDEDVAAGKEMKVASVGKGGVLDIQPSYDVPNRTNSSIEKLRYTVIKFDLLKSVIPDFVFEEGSIKYTESSKYQPIIHFNNLNYATRKIYTPGIGYSDRILDTTYLPVYRNINHVQTSNKSKVEYFYNKRNLSMYFRGNGLNGENISEFIIDNLKLYEVDMIPFFQYFTEGNINRNVSVPYQAVAPLVSYSESDYSQIDSNLYGIDSFYIYQPSGEVNIQAESSAAAAEAAQLDPVINQVVVLPPEDEPDVVWPTWGSGADRPAYGFSDPYAPAAAVTSCLVENTVIEMADGSFRMIQDVVAGESIRSISVSGMPADAAQWHSWSDSEMIYEPSASVVGSNTSFDADSTILINGLLETTTSHNNVIKRDGQWMIRRSGEILIGDIFMDSLYNEIEIESIEILNVSVRVYNIELEGSKLYFANGILTHNKQGDFPWNNTQSDVGDMLSAQQTQFSFDPTPNSFNSSSFGQA